MKKTVIFSLVVLIAAITSQGEGKKRGKPIPSPTSTPKMGLRFGNGPCICKGPRASSAPGWNRTPEVHPTAGHHPSRPHGPSRHHSPHPHGHHPSRPHGPPRHHSSHPHGHHPSRPPHHNRHPHSHPPTRRPMGNKHKNGGMKKRHRGHQNRGPKQRHPTKAVWKKCVCRKPEKGFRIKFRMMKTWLPELANPRSEAYRQLTYRIIMKIAIVLKTGTNNIYNMRYKKGSIVAEFEVKQSDMTTTDPEKALRHTIHKGQLRDLEIQPESLVVQQSYSGVKLSEWKTDEDECHRCGSVKQTRDCIEVTASCDGIPLTRNASCYEACPRGRLSRCRGSRMPKMLIIACFIIVGALVIITVLVVTKIKRNRRKYLKTSPSTSSIKKLADDDKLQSNSKC